MDYRHVVVQFARTIMHDFSDDEEDATVLEKIDNYAEETVPNFTDRQFKQNFRLTPETFEDLLQKIHSVLPLNHRGGFPRTKLEKELMITIWCLGNLESFRSVAERFGISKSTCWEILYRTCRCLLQVNRRFRIICWPSEERQAEIERNFSENGFPGIIGCIDGCHIRITAPRNHPNSYINRKHYHSVLLQGVCDNSMLFTDIYAGEAGSIHDMNLFRRSDVYQKILNGGVTFFNDSHIIGDLAYQLSPYLMVGFKRIGVLTVRQQNFNVVLSRKRVIIENAFALLKGRFRRLKLLETKKLDLVCLLIMSGCILHNVCIQNGDLPDDIVDLADEVANVMAENPNNFLDIDEGNQNQQAINKRNNIIDNIPLP